MQNQRIRVIYTNVSPGDKFERRLIVLDHEKLVEACNRLVEQFEGDYVTHNFRFETIVGNEWRDYVPPTHVLERLTD